jgi:phosphatidylglycerophosphate synthase
MSAPRPALDRLRRQWTYHAGGCGAFVACVVGALAIGSSPRVAIRWGIPTVIVLACFFFRLVRSLSLNHPPDAPERLHSSLGIANFLTIVRAVLVASLGGFLFLAPVVAWETAWDWLPGMVYLTAVAMDYADGYLARITYRVTRLGEFLDTQVDALGLLLAGLILVFRAKAPLPYLWVGLGYYVLQAAIRLRSVAGRPVGRVAPRPDARWAAGCEMVYAALALLPVFKPEATRPAAWVMTLAMGISLGMDWRIVCGHAPESGRARSRMQDQCWKVLGGGLPLALRFAITAVLILTCCASPNDPLGDIPWPIRSAALVSGVLCALGVAARAAAVLLSLICALWLIPTLPGSVASFTLMASIALMLTGAGHPRMWQPEDRFLMKKRGPRTPHSQRAVGCRDDEKSD